MPGTRKTISAAAVALVVAAVIAVLACVPRSAQPSTPTGTHVEVEDCDAEDYANRETDCGFLPGGRRRVTPPPSRPSVGAGKPTPAKTTGKAPTKALTRVPTRGKR